MSKKHRKQLAADKVVSALQATLSQRLGFGTTAGIFGFLRDTVINLVLNEGLEWLKAVQGRRVVLSNIGRGFDIKFFEPDGTEHKFEAKESDPGNG